MMRIVTLTLNPTIDMSTTVEQVVSERKLRCSEPVRDPGGGGINVSRGLKRLGVGSIAVWARGGTTGRLLEELLEREGIEQEPIPIEGTTRENVSVFETGTGRQYRFGMPGAALRPEELRASVDRIRSLAPSFLIVSGSLPPGVEPSFMGELRRAALEIGSRLIVDTSGPALQAVLGEGVALIKPNVAEFGESAGIGRIDDEVLAARAAEWVIEGKSEAIVISLGTAGALLVTAEFSLRIPSPTVPIESTIGAGDSMVAGIVSGMSQSWPLSRSVALGVATGAAAVMTPGTELFRAEDARRLHPLVERSIRPV